MPPAPPVTVPVSRGDVLQTVIAPGQLVTLSEQFLSFPLSGRIASLGVRPGMAVSTGQILARLDDTALKETLHRTEIRLAQAEAATAQALVQAELDQTGTAARINSARGQVPTLTAAQVRLEAAREAEARAETEYQKALDRPWEPDEVREGYRLGLEAARDARQIAEAEVTALQQQQWAVAQEISALEAEAARLAESEAYLASQGIDPLLLLDVETAARDLAAATLTAPADGVILEVYVRPGEQVQPGQPLFLLGDPARAEVRTSVIEEDIPLVEIGQPVEIFFDARPDLLLTGRVDRLVPQRLAGEERPLFAADAAHELNTPLTALRANLELLQVGEPPQARRLVEAREQVARLEKVTADLLDLSRIESQPEEAFPVELNGLIAAVAEQVAGQAEQLGLNLALILPERLLITRGHDWQLRRALENLLDNALKYSGPGDDVELSLYEANGEAVVQLRDHGRGLNPNELPHLFHRFYRGRNTADTPGSGLGLAIVDAIVTRHGGRLTAAANPDRGATFTIRLPLDAKTPAA